MRATGNSPVKLADSSRDSPGALFDPRPLDPSYGGCSRASSTCATGFALPACTQIEGIAYDGAFPLSLRFTISQSRNWPRPPSPILPAPTPPKGNESIAS
jgi:hypothetical protein